MPGEKAPYPPPPYPPSPLPFYESLWFLNMFEQPNRYRVQVSGVLACVFLLKRRAGLGKVTKLGICF